MKNEELRKATQSHTRAKAESRKLKTEMGAQATSMRHQSHPEAISWLPAVDLPGLTEC
jgi:hypothetical protein